jgi:hypothetical protein
MIPGLGGGKVLNAASGSVSMLSGFLRTRILLAKLLVVGVAGRTLTEACGLRLVPILMLDEAVGEAKDAEAEDVDEALEILC